MIQPADASGWPLVTVVTPSLNQGRFLRDTLESVAAQDYPHIEHLVLDAGSRDESHDILRAFAADHPNLQWRAAADRGQSDAINQGLARARGTIVAWLNADDVYTRGAVSAAVMALCRRPDAGLVYGRGEIINEAGKLLGPFLGWEPFCLWRLVHALDFVLQPATFFRRDLALRLGGLDENLCWSMDWDLWIRLAAAAEVIELDRVLARAREHPASKTAVGGWPRIRELRRLARRHAGRGWTPGVRLYACDTLHRQLRATMPGALADRLGRSLERLMGHIGRRLPVHPDGWLGPRGALMVPRRWQRARLVLEALETPASGFEVAIEAHRSELARMRFETAGQTSCEFDLPAGNGPFVTLLVRSQHRFRALPPSPDRRLLSVLCRDLRKAG